jgi:hypothetical protein
MRWDRDAARWFALLLVACAVVCFNRLERSEGVTPTAREVGLEGVEVTQGSWETLKGCELVGIDLCHAA